MIRTAKKLAACVLMLGVLVCGTKRCRSQSAR